MRHPRVAIVLSALFGATLGFHIAAFVCAQVLVATGNEYNHGHIGTFTLVALGGALVGAVGSAYVTARVVRKVFHSGPAA